MVHGKRIGEEGMTDSGIEGQIRNKAKSYRDIFEECVDTSIEEWNEVAKLLSTTPEWVRVDDVLECVRQTEATRTKQLQDFKNFLEYQMNFATLEESRRILIGIREKFEAFLGEASSQEGSKP